MYEKLATATYAIHSFSHYRQYSFNNWLVTIYKRRPRQDSWERKFPKRYAVGCRYLHEISGFHLSWAMKSSLSRVERTTAERQHTHTHTPEQPSADAVSLRECVCIYNNFVTIYHTDDALYSITNYKVINYTLHMCTHQLRHTHTHCELQ